MSEETLADSFKSFCAAQYGAEDPSRLPVRQRLEAEDAFYAGASSAFYSAFGASDVVAIAMHHELQAFGKRIVERYREAGLPLGQKRH